MSLPPIDKHDYSQNPFEKSKLFKAAANALQQAEAKAAPVQPAPVKPNITSVSTWPSRGQNHFAITTQQILNLIQRFRLRSMTYEQLISLPMSQLRPEERDFVNYMRRNPRIFQQISSLDKEPGLSAQDVKLAAQLAGDALMLSDEDMRYLRQSPLPEPATARQLQPANNLSPTGRLQTQDLLNALNRLTRQQDIASVPFETLMQMSALDSGLRGRNLESLRFLQTPTVSKVLAKIVQPYDNMVTPEALRVLTSLLWNPSIYGAAPIVFFKNGPSHPDWDEEIHDIDIVGEVDDHKHEQIRPTKRKPSLRIAAHTMLDILYNISDDAQATLEQIREYRPRNFEEEKTLNLLRQHNVFEALACLDEDPSSLSKDDVKIALAEHALVLSDPYMVLVILP